MRPLAAIIFISVGLFFLYLGGRTTYRGIASSYWPTAEARIVSSTVKSEVGKKGGLIYNAQVNYAYTVNGESLTSGRVRFGSITTGNPIRPTLIVEKYPVGSSVTVHYSASDPFFAVLEPGIQSASLIVVGIGVLFAGVGVAAILMPKRCYQRQRYPMT
jgi:hypothetical protein